MHKNLHPLTNLVYSDKKVLDFGKVYILLKINDSDSFIILVITTRIHLAPPKYFSN